MLGEGAVSSDRGGFRYDTAARLDYAESRKARRLIGNFVYNSGWKRLSRYKSGFDSVLVVNSNLTS